MGTEEAFLLEIDLHDDTLSYTVGNRPCIDTVSRRARSVKDR